MEDAFVSFYNTLDPGKFKYFTKDDHFYVYNSDISYLPPELKPKSDRGFVRLQNIENIIRDILVVKRVPVEEYSGYKLTKCGFPGDYGAFLDICLGEGIPPTVVAVVQLQSGELDVSFIRDSKIHRCRFYDDDLLSNLFSLCSSNNCIEILYNTPHFERIFNGWGVSLVVSKCSSSDEMIRKYLKLSMETVEFVKEDCCIVNIADFDLVDLGVVTAQGKRLLNQWLRSPCVEQAEIERRLNLTEAFSQISVSVNRFSDLKRIIPKITRGSITAPETVKLCQTLEQIGELLGGFRTSTFPHPELVSSSFIAPLENLWSLALPLISKIKEMLNFTSSRIHTHLSVDLTRLETEKFELLKEVESEFLRVKKDYPKMSFSNKCFKISRLEYNQSEFDSKRYVIASMLKTGVSFLTKTLAELNKRIAAIEMEINKIERRMFEALVGALGDYVGLLETLNYLVALIDVHKAFGLKAKSEMYSRPVFSKDKYSVSCMHHPVLEHRGCILNSVEFTRDVCVLTGPNMGGKSTFLKALSMVSLYAQVGCYVPAKSATLPIFDRIFLRIGARDCASQRQSTFMVEMSDLNKIIRTATRQSLILIDELGRGTSAVDGLSLALSVRNYLIKLGAKTVMATHFSELGSGETMNKKMCVEGGVLMYRVVDGICDLSFGVNVAEMAGFPPEVLKRAQEYIGVDADS